MAGTQRAVAKSCAPTATSFAVRQNNVRTAIHNNVPRHPPVLGPFGVFDARGYVDQTVFDWESIERERSSAARVKSAESATRTPTR